jgi:hypothetical protein
MNTLGTTTSFWPQGNSQGYPPSKKGPQRPVRQTPAQVEDLSGQVLTDLKNNPNENVSALADAIGVTDAELKRPIAVLLESNHVSKRGKRRATKYSAA